MLLLVLNGIVLLVMALMILGQLIFLLDRDGGAGRRAPHCICRLVVAVQPHRRRSGDHRGRLRHRDAQPRPGCLVLGAHPGHRRLRCQCRRSLCPRPCRSHAQRRCGHLGRSGPATRSMFETDRPTFVRRVARHAALRGLAGVFVFDPEKQAHRRQASRPMTRSSSSHRQRSSSNKAKAASCVVIQPGSGRQCRPCTDQAAELPQRLSLWSTA